MPKVDFSAFQTLGSADLLASFRPHAKQEELLRSAAPNKGMFGGNKTGKTYWLIYELWCHLLGEHPYLEVPKPPVAWWLVVPKFPETKDERIESLELLKRFAPKRALKGGSWERSWNGGSFTLSLEVPYGSYLQVKSQRQEPDQFESGRLHGIAYDEPGPEWQWTAGTARLIFDRGKRLFAGTVLNSTDHSWVEDVLWTPSQNGDPDFKFVTCAMAENPHLVRDGYEAIQKMLDEIPDEEEREARETGRFHVRSGPVFKSFLRRVHVAGKRLKPVGTTFPIIRSWDIAVTHAHPSVVWLQLHGERVYVLQHLVKRTLLRDFVEEVVALSTQLFPEYEFLDYVDPASSTTANLREEEESAKDVLKAFGMQPINGVKAFQERANNLSWRLRHLTSDGKASIVFCPEQGCVNPATNRWENVLVKGLESGYRYKYIKVSGAYAEVPEKNVYSHVVDALLYAPIGPLGSLQGDRKKLRKLTPPCYNWRGPSTTTPLRKADYKIPRRMT